MDSADYFKHIQNPICIQSALHWIHLQRWLGSEFKQDVIDIHDLCETIPTINLLSWIMACLWQACGRLVTSVRVYFESLHSALLFYRCWERKRLFLYRCWLFSGDWEEWYNITKENYDGLIVLLIQFDVKLQPVLVGQTPEQLSSIILVNWYICRYFWCCIAFCWQEHYVLHPHLPQFASNLFTCCALWKWSVRIQHASQQASCECAYRYQCNHMYSIHNPRYTWYTETSTMSIMYL